MGIPKMTSSTLVSTHSRLKAAGAFNAVIYTYRQSFNTQPPEGGWSGFCLYWGLIWRFNTQPPEGGWGITVKIILELVCFNTQPPEGGWISVS